MPTLFAVLRPAKVNLNDLILDPNNPRFASLGQKLDSVPEARFNEAKVQQQTYERMKTPRFDVAELRDTIINLGFLPMDRIVVRPWKVPDSKGKYVVVEGNRRVTALKWLLELHDSGRETFTPEQLKNFTELEVLLLDDDEAPINSRLILPGLRHVSGIKEWGPYVLPGTITIPEQISKNKDPYYQALEAADRANASGKLDLTEMEHLLESLLANQLVSVLDSARSDI